VTVADLPLWREPAKRYAVPPAAPGSRTSEAAAVRVTRRAPTMREHVRLYLVSRGDYGATRQEIADALGMRLQSVCGRVAELLERTQAVATERRRESREVLIAATEAGMDARSLAQT